MRSDDKTDDQYHYHMRQLAHIRQAWQRGEISITQKRRQIADENRTYYEGDLKSAITGEKITAMPRRNDELAGVIADSTGAPIEAVEIALNRRREACARAANAETLEESRELYADAFRSFRQVMAAAAPRRTP